MKNTNKKHFTYTHWLKIDTNNELEKWEQLVKYKEKYDCSMTVFYYNYNPIMNKVVKLECNQSYEDLDLDVNSLFSESLIRLKYKPSNISIYNKKVEDIYIQNCYNSLEESIKEDLKKMDKRSEISKVEKGRYCFNFNFEKFFELCEFDMTKPHLGSIRVKQNNLLVTCEKFSPELEEYVFCDGGRIEDKELLSDFLLLKSYDKKSVLDFVSHINNLLDWNQIDKKLEKAKYEEYEEGFKPYKMPCKKLGDGWFWYKYSDGSGYLLSPEGKEYMSYDLQTHEYQETRDSKYEFFPLNYYYLDGVEPSEFKPFEYMEDEMLNYVLPNEEKNKVVDTSNDMEL